MREKRRQREALISRVMTVFSYLACIVIRIDQCRLVQLLIDDPSMYFI